MLATSSQRTLGQCVVYKDSSAEFRKPDAMDMTTFCLRSAHYKFRTLVRDKRRVIKAGALLASGLLPINCELALARELYFQPKAIVGLEYDDNIRMLTDSNSGNVDKSAYGVVSQLEGLLGARSDLYEIKLNNRFEIKRYESDLDQDSENIFIDLSSYYNITPRNEFSLSGNYTRDTTLTSELDVTGLVQSNIIRELWSITPEWTYSLTNNQFLRANYTHYDVMYEDSDITARFFDYTTDFFSLSYIQQWTELLNTYLSVSAMTFDVPDIGRETTEYTVNVGGEYQFLPTWAASFSVGRRFTNTELSANGVVIEDDAQGMVFSISVDKQFEDGSASISYSRSTSAQGNGRQQLFDKFAANYHQKITQNFAVSLNGGIHDTTTSGSSQDFGIDRTYYYITPSVNWYFNRQAHINAGYRYRMQEFQSNSDKAVSNTVFISFTYQWDKLRTQRY